jgi:metal-responsive CopG/Arc/MetJ family transcriptional regulator
MEMIKEKRVQIAIRLGGSTLKALDEMAERNRRARSDMVRVIIENAVRDSDDSLKVEEKK